MSIKSASIPLGPTAWTPTGGSAVTLKVIKAKDDTVHVYLDENLSILSRMTVQFQALAPSVSPSAPGGYTQARNKCTLLAPYALDNGVVTKNKGYIELSLDPEATPSERKALRYNLALLLLEDDFDEYWDELSIE